MAEHKSEASRIKLKSNLLWKQKPYDTKTRWWRNYSACNCGEKNSLWYPRDLGAHYPAEMKSSNYHAIKVLESINKSVSCGGL